MRMLKDWWKFIGIFLILFVIYKGFTIDVPQLEILNESQFEIITEADLTKAAQQVVEMAK